VDRRELITVIVRRLCDVRRPHVVRVAVDGVDAAGKTTLANELATCIRQEGRPVIRADIDGFHNPRAIRYQRDSLSPEGFYLDSFDNPAIVNVLLAPLGPGGSGEYRTAVFDHVSDAPVSSPFLKAERRAILLFDGVFLLRNELRSYWDFTIFVKAGFQTTLARARSRDSRLFGSPEEVERRYNARYIPGQKLYLEECVPAARADLVIDNSDPAHPSLVEGPRNN
jgi:uridine kinase